MADLLLPSPLCSRYLTEPPEPTQPTWAETAPMPADPLTCRWCGGRLRALLEDRPATYCERGCERNDQGYYVADCADCGRPFRTGLPAHSAVRCVECIAADHPDEAQRAGAELPQYEDRPFGRGHWRW